MHDIATPGRSVEDATLILKLRTASDKREYVAIDDGGRIPGDAGRAGTWMLPARMLVSVLTEVTPTSAPRVLRLRGCRVVGQVDLKGCRLQMPLELAHCELDEI